MESHYHRFIQGARKVPFVEPFMGAQRGFGSHFPFSQGERKLIFCFFIQVPRRDVIVNKRKQFGIIMAPRPDLILQNVLKNATDGKFIKSPSTFLARCYLGKVRLFKCRIKVNFQIYKSSFCNVPWELRHDPKLSRNILV